MDELLAISAIQHFAYCPRQFALIHIERAWQENRLTAEGRLLHERVDAGEPEQRLDIRYERSVQLYSERYRLKGKMDLLEIQTGDEPIYRPVEYKRGKSKVEDWDRLQLCAQALCLEDMRGISIYEAALWYWQTRRRETVTLDAALRNRTQSIVHDALELIAQGKTPAPVVDKKFCRACSLQDICMPQTLRTDRSGQYREMLFDL